MLADRSFVPREDELGPDVGKRFEDEAAMRQSRMGEGEEILIQTDIPKVEDIEVEDARRILLRYGDAADVIFDSLGCFEEIVRLADEVDFNDGIVKIAGVGRTIDGLALVNPGLEVVRALGHEVHEKIASFPEIGETVAEIRAEGNACAVCHQFLFKAKDILHVVKSRLLIGKPERSTHGAESKGHARGCFVSELKALTVSREHHGVITDNIATTEGVHSDFFRRAWAGLADATVSHIVFIRGVCFLIENLKQGASGAGGSIDLVAMVHFGDLDIEGFISENGSGLAREVEEDVDSGGEVRSVDDGDRFRRFKNGRLLRIAVTGGAYDEGGLG